MFLKRAIVLEDIIFGYNNVIKQGTEVDIVGEEKDMDIVLIKDSNGYKVRVSKNKVKEVTYEKVKIKRYITQIIF